MIKIRAVFVGALYMVLSALLFIALAMGIASDLPPDSKADYDVVRTFGIPLLFMILFCGGGGYAAAKRSPNSEIRSAAVVGVIGLTFHGFAVPLYYSIFSLQTFGLYTAVVATLFCVPALAVTAAKIYLHDQRKLGMSAV